MKLALRSFVFALVVCVTRSAAPSETAVSLERVLAMMAKVPAVERPGAKSWRWDQMGDAREIAQAIAKVARDDDRAGDMVVYAIRESGLRKRAAGDRDKRGIPHSFGPWQISDKRLDPEKAMDPYVAAITWDMMAADSRRDCAALPEDEQLAEVASGNCAHGRQKARDRARVRRSILE